jgi:hypothetical protein
VHIERLNSAYRLGIAIALVYALWKFAPTFWPGVIAYKNVVVDNARASRAAADAGKSRVATDVPGKLSAANLESMLRESKQFPPDAEPRCQPAARDWDYVCSYMPEPRRSSARLQFGVQVDAARWLKVSSIVPTGVAVPAPR